MEPKFSQQSFIALAKKIHQGKYDYSLAVCSAAKSKVIIICPDHGHFVQEAYRHLEGRGCRSCGVAKSSASRSGEVEAFIEKASRLHVGRYSYEDVDYVNNRTKVSITCLEHGPFLQIPNAHLNGAGCPSCGAEARSKSKTTTPTQFVIKAKMAHGNRYRYPEAYVSAKAKLRIECPKHGDFHQTPNKHLGGQGCPQCGIDEQAERQRGDTETFIEKAKGLYGDLYDYSSVVYEKANKKVLIGCPEHGLFAQTPNNHLRGRKCHKCKGSDIEKDLYEALLGFGKDLEKGNRTLLKGRELDLYFPEHQLAIELNGILWHSSFAEKQKGRDWVRNHQVQKTKDCEAIGVRLLHYYEDEVRNSKDAVIRQIEMALGIHKSSIGARTTKVVHVQPSKAREFLNQYHLQGYVKGLAYGLEHEGQLMAVMSFSTGLSKRGKQAEETTWELVRYASKDRVVGGASKLLKAFLEQHPLCTEIFSYSDNRWATGGMYEKLGFNKVDTLPPDYYYVKDNQRLHKSGFRRAALQKKFPDQFDFALSERENCYNLGFYQLFNCGLTKWTLTL